MKMMAMTLLIVAFVSLSASCGEPKKEGEATIRIAPGTTTAEIARMLVEEDDRQRASWTGQVRPASTRNSGPGPTGSSAGVIGSILNSQPRAPKS
jgi:hypothetical protein